MTKLSLSVLGPFAASLDERPLTQFRTKSVQALLVYLACQPEVHSREQLMALLWPDIPQQSAQGSLRQTLYLLRKAIPELPSRDGSGMVPLLLTDRQTIQMNPNGSFDLDLRTFTEKLKGDESGWPEAVTLYRGDFLADFYLPDSAPFEEWAAARRGDLRRQVLDALDTLTKNNIQSNDLDTAETYARRQLELDNLRESAHRQLMEILARNSRRRAALSHYEICRQLLQDELGIEPSAETQALYQQIRSGASPFVLPTKGTPDTIIKPSPRTVAHPPHNLPTQVTAFVGRQRELSQTANLLKGTRLLTLTGPGGSGKTRLALQLAAAQLTHFPDGVFFVSLASLKDPRLVEQTIASILDVKPVEGQSVLKALQDYLRPKQVLLILDNYEHLLDAATVASNLLSSTDQLRIVATSREPLQLRGEQLYPVPPLRLPGEDAETKDEVAQVEAVQLFLLRAQATDPTFQLTDDNLATVVTICQRLDGLPLALELAAARLSAYSPALLLERLCSRLNVLTRGLRDLPHRQQTLRDTIAWSYDLLNDDEQLLFSRLGVFAGRWTLTDAEAVCSPGLSVAVADGLESLIDKNLVQLAREMIDQSCYDMLAAIREFAVEQLQIDQEELAVVERLARHVANQLPATVPTDRYGANRQIWFKFLALEMDNIRTALAYFLDHAEVEPVQQIIDEVSDYWADRLVEEGSDWLDRLLDLLGDDPTAARGKALFQQGNLYVYGYDNRRAAALLEASTQCFQACNDQQGLFDALDSLGLAYHALGDYEQMRQTFKKLIPLAEKLGDNSALRRALCRSVLGTTDFIKARETLCRCLELAAEDGQPGTFYKQWLADIEIRLGNYTLASNMLRECQTAWQQMGQERSVVAIHFLLGEAEIRRGQLNDAGRILTEGLDLVSDFADVDFPPYFYERFATLAAAHGDFERAAQLFGAAEAARELPGATALNPEYRPAYEKDVAVVRAGLSEAAFASAWQRGRVMSIEEATAFALGR